MSTLLPTNEKIYPTFNACNELSTTELQEQMHIQKVYMYCFLSPVTDCLSLGSVSLAAVTWHLHWQENAPKTDAMILRT